MFAPYGIRLILNNPNKQDYCRAREIPLTGEMSQSDKRVCRIADLLLPNIKKYLTFYNYMLLYRQ
jgi:hypothetical protein